MIVLTLRQRAALMIRSLMRDLRVDTHVIIPQTEPAISSTSLLTELESEATLNGLNDGDAALAIGEHAFRAGYERGYSAGFNDADPKPDEAWSDYVPSEDIKELS
jgi:hypothetical protein